MTRPMTNQTLIRERTYRWAPPSELAAAAQKLGGLEFLSKIASGELPQPPAGVTTGIVPVEIGDGYAIFELEPAEWHYNPIGSVHGGILSTLADSALGCAIHTKLLAGTGYTSLDLTVKFTRAPTLNGGSLRCIGRVLTLGRRTGTAEAQITDASGRLIAHAVTTCLILSQ